MHHFQEDEERMIVLLSSGNLAVTQAVLHRVTSSNRKSNEDLEKKELPQNLKEVADLYQTAELVGDAVRAVYQCVIGKVRYTYSSVGRLQVKLSAANPERYLVACNQRRTPLQGVAKKESAVPGVRFKAWHPPEALHSSLPVQNPLVFDLFERFTETIIGGC